MKPTSPYPVLDNRPIDQWKVAELKEELKRRQLTTKGLKDDLIRRLDEALRNELESVKENTINVSHNTPESVGVLDDTPKPVEIIDGEGEKNIFEKNESVTTHVNGTENKENIGGDSGVKEESVVRVSSVETNTLVNEVLADEGVVQEREDGDTGLVKNEETIVHVTSVENNITVNEIVTDGMGIDFQDTLKDEIKIQLENLESEPLQDIGLSEIVTDGMGIDLQDSLKNDIKIQLDAEVAIPLQDDVMLESSDPSNQVSDVSTVLGFEVKTDSISSDNQKNELKDNIIADNINLELDVKPEMVNPSSSNVLSDKNEPHPMDVEDPCDTKEPVEERDEKTDLEMSKKNDSLDMGSSEKLNLDRSSGDDSMEDDTIENKPIDSKWNSKGVGKTEGFVTEDAPVVMSEDIPADMKDVDETKKVSAAPLVKRKLNDQKVVGYNEPSKRQRRWNTENLKVPEPQNNLGLSTTPKDKLLPTILKPSLSRVDSTASEGTPKERVVPPSPKSPTTSLRIDQFVRPFTLKAVQELLGKTGNVTSFWMDHIKTHCYVSYSSVEEATETRNAVYNLQWPPNGGRHLLAEFVDPQEVKTRAEAPPPPSPATTVPPRTPTAAQPPRQVAQRQQHLPPPPPLPLPPPPPLSNPPQSRERVLPPPPPMEEAEKMDTPVVTLDDLFRKTKATPRIYYLPLTDEQVAAKRRITRQ